MRSHSQRTKPIINTENEERDGWNEGGGLLSGWPVSLSDREGRKGEPCREKSEHD